MLLVINTAKKSIEGGREGWREGVLREGGKKEGGKEERGKVRRQ